MVHPDPTWKPSSNLQEIYQYRMYGRKLLMMGKGNYLKHVEFFDKIIFGKICASGLFY